ncbi:MAG: hypothetical protein JW833_03815 [Prolixibacteraceae bacterium]|nr:hypothetical protein [Prolixibacteraceae bacterium]
MNSEIILFKEVTYYKNKGLRFLILFFGEAVIAILIFIISQLIKTDEAIGNSFLNYIIAFVFLLLLIPAVLLTWGGFFMQNDVIVTCLAVYRSFKMPPLVKRNYIVSKDIIQSVSWLSENRLIYKNKKLIQNPGNIHFQGNKFNELIIEYKGGQKLILETLNPEGLEQAIVKMLKNNRS